MYCMNKKISTFKTIFTQSKWRFGVCPMCVNAKKGVHFDTFPGGIAVLLLNKILTETMYIYC